MMFEKRSIRFRLTAWYAVVLTAGLGLLSVLVWLALRQQLLTDLDNDLDGRARRLESYFRNESAKAGVSIDDELDEFCQALPETSYVTLSGDQGFRYRFPTNEQSPAPSRTLRHDFDVDGETYHLDLGTPIQDVTYVLDRLRLLLLSLLPVVIAVACIGGAWLSSRALKPVQDVTAAALTISIENLSARLPVPTTGDEVAHLTEVLNSMLARLDAAVGTLAQFAADASHELRTPLAVIRTTAELALRRARTEESYRESIQAVLHEAERMTQLVEDLLMLARSDGALKELQRTQIDLRDILQDVRTEMSSLAEASEIRIVMQLGQTPANVLGTASMLHRLFVLLLDNAIKYSNRQSEVRISLIHSESTTAVHISDSGTGIADEDLPHIFKRFYRADKARSGSGHGLGLPLAESIARVHGASIEVESAEGSGSTFRVIFQNESVEDTLSQSPLALEARPAS